MPKLASDQINKWQPPGTSLITFCLAIQYEKETLDLRPAALFDSVSLWGYYRPAFLPWRTRGDSKWGASRQLNFDPWTWNARVELERSE